MPLTEGDLPSKLYMYTLFAWLESLKKKRRKKEKYLSLSLIISSRVYGKYLSSKCAKGASIKAIFKGCFDFLIGNSLEFCIMQGQLAKHVGCEISGRLDKIHPERENKVRSNEL